jgi:hypothetical protein
MNNVKTVILGVLASTVVLTGASAQGLIGTNYSGINGGYEQVKVPGITLDGWGAGVEFNSPMPTQAGQFGFDFNLQGDYIRVTDSGITRTVIDTSGLLRGFTTTQGGFRPYLGSGLGWMRVRHTGESTDDSFIVPVEAGVEIRAGQISVSPYFRYSWTLDSGWDDFWTVGGKGAYWLRRGWGVSVDVAYTDWDNNVESLGVRVGVLFVY